MLIYMAGVAAPPAAASQDEALAAKLTTAGHTVTWGLSTAALPSSGYDACVVTESGSGTSAAIVSIPTCPLPVLIMETSVNTAKLSSAAAASAGTGTAYDITTAGNAHAITSTLADPLTVTSSSANQYGPPVANVPAGAQILATGSAFTTTATVIVAESGAVLDGGTVALARRAFLGAGVGGSIVASWTTGADSLFIKMVEWLPTPVGPAFDDTAFDSTAFYTADASALASVSTSRSTTWAAVALVGTSRSSNWAALTSVTASRATTWNVAGPLASVTATRSSTWATAATLTATRATTWAVRTPVSTSRLSTWAVASAVTTTRASTWTVVAPVTATRAATWTALTSVTATRPTTWAARTPVTTSRATTWGTAASVVATRATTWQALTSASTSRATTWQTQSRVSAARATSWNTAGNLLSVSASRATSWATKAQASAAKATSWTVLTPATTQRVATWDTRGTAATSRATSWSTGAQIGATRATTWATLQALTATRGTSWALDANAAPTGPPILGRILAVTLTAPTAEGELTTPQGVASLRLPAASVRLATPTARGELTMPDINQGSRVHVDMDIKTTFNSTECVVEIKVDQTWHPASWTAAATVENGKWIRHAATDGWFAGSAVPADKVQGATVLAGGRHPTAARLTNGGLVVVFTGPPIDVKD